MAAIKEGKNQSWGMPHFMHHHKCRSSIVLCAPNHTMKNNVKQVAMMSAFRALFCENSRSFFRSETSTSTLVRSAGN
jgi:hypothetical protein